MPLQIKRGPTADRTGFTPLVGELVFDTDQKVLYVGDGATTGGIASTSITLEDAQDAAASLLTSGSHSGISFTYNDTANRIDATITALDSGFIATDIKGSVFADDSTLLVDGVSGRLRGPLTSDRITIGSDSNPALEIFEESSTVSTVAARSGSIVRVNSSGVSIGTTTSDNFLRVFNVGTTNGNTVLLQTYFDGADSNFLALTKSRGTAAAPLPLNVNDTIYRIRFAGSDGTQFLASAQISCDVTDAVSTGVVPGRLNFLTADSGGVLRSALQITSSQDVRISTSLLLENSSGILSATQNGQTSRVLLFRRNRGTVATPTVVQTDDHIYTLRFSGYDGAFERISSQIRGEVAGTVTPGAVPGRLRFITANSAGTLTTAMTISESQLVTVTSNLQVDGTITGNLTGNVRGDLIGSVFSDDSTMIIDGTNGNIPGYVSVATLKSIAAASATYGDFQTAIAAL